jgi:hypothetical protein
MSDLLLDVKVWTVEGPVCGGERACGVSLRQIMAITYQAVTAAALSAAWGGAGYRLDVSFRGSPTMTPVRE